MASAITRRTLWALVPLALPLTRVRAAPAAAVPDIYPLQPPELVREMVGASHGRVERVRELLDHRPTLSLAAVDWGFGDWESALGAASHVGNREIAELLIAHGARPNLFSAAMLGQLDVVKALIAAQPGAQRIPGPHGIPLLAHARAGGDAAAPVVEYLESLGDAGGPPRLRLSQAEIESILGTYAFGDGPHDNFVVELNRKLLMIKRGEAQGRALKPIGDGTFHPAGAPDVIIRFTGGDEDRTLTIHDADLVIAARRRRPNA